MWKRILSCDGICIFTWNTPKSINFLSFCCFKTSRAFFQFDFKNVINLKTEKEPKLKLFKLKCKRHRMTNPLSHALFKYSTLGFNFTEYEIKVNSYGITRVYKKRWIRQFIQMIFSILIQNIWALYIATYPEDSNSRPMDHSYFIKQIAFDLIGKEQRLVDRTVCLALIFV